MVLRFLTIGADHFKGGGSEVEQAEVKAEEEEHPVIREFNAGCRYYGTRVSRSSSRPTRKRKPDGLGAAVVSVILKELKRDNRAPHCERYLGQSV